MRIWQRVFGLGEFVKEIGPPRFIEVGVAEQNLVTVASGLGWFLCSVSLDSL